jgi:RNA polymerase sigma factor (sigma-70 family)
MERSEIDTILRAAEDAVPPLQDRPPPSVIVGAGHPAFAAVGMKSVPGSRLLTDLGYVVSYTKSDLAGVSVGPLSVLAQTTDESTARILAVSVCRPLTAEESALAAAYAWLPAKIVRNMFWLSDAARQDDLVTDVGFPYLCYSTIRYNKKYRFRTYAERILGLRLRRHYAQSTRGVRTISIHRQLTGSRVGTIADTIADTRPVPEPVVDSPETAEMILARLVAPYVTEQQKVVLTAKFGLDGRKPQTLRTIGRALGLSFERIRQISEQALAHARAYHRNRTKCGEN